MEKERVVKYCFSIFSIVRKTNISCFHLEASIGPILCCLEMFNNISQNNARNVNQNRLRIGSLPWRLGDVKLR